MNRARQIIKEKGITKGQLVDAGFSDPTIKKIMESDNWPDPKTYAETLITVAQVLGVSIDDLYGNNTGK